MSSASPRPKTSVHLASGSKAGFYLQRDMVLICPYCGLRGTVRINRFSASLCSPQFMVCDSSFKEKQRGCMRKFEVEFDRGVLHAYRLRSEVEND